jgi:glycosyltransferase involved in cell wall biosynthesis
MSHQYSKKKKVLFLITKSNWGGAQRYVYDLATNLDPHRYEPVVAMGGAGELAVMLRNAGIRTITINSLIRDVSVRHEWQFFTELCTILKAEAPDIFHINSSKAGAVGAVAGRYCRIPTVIFTAHGWAFNEHRPLWQKLVIKTIHWITVLLSHRTIAVSRAIITQMDWPWAERKMKLIHPGRTIGPMYDRSEAREKIADFFPRLAAYKHDPWIFCIAELHPIKRHDVLFTAMHDVIAKHPNARLICIGNGQWRGRLETTIQKNGLAEHVFLTGNLTEAARFIKAADILTLVSDSESYGYVIHEAGLGGIPVVATNTGGIPDIVTNKVSGLLVPCNDPTAVGQALLTILEQPERGGVFSKTLHDHMSIRTVSRMTLQTEALYKSLR